MSRHRNHIPIDSFLSKSITNVGIRQPPVQRPNLLTGIQPPPQPPQKSFLQKASTFLTTPLSSKVAGGIANVGSTIGTALTARDPDSAAGSLAQTAQGIVRAKQFEGMLTRARNNEQIRPEGLAGLGISDEDIKTNLTDIAKALNLSVSNSDDEAESDGGTDDLAP